MTIETEDELARLRAIGRIVATILEEMQERTEPGMTTAELDGIGGELLERYGARSAPKITYDFPGYTCISVNEEAAHGVPGARVIEAGDLVNVDVSAEKDGFFADTGGSFVVPPATGLQKRLLHATRLALQRASEEARAGRPLNRIGHAIQKVAKRNGFRILRGLCSHGIGRRLHESPAQIPGYYDPRDRRVLHDGLVMTIEPFLSTRSTSVTEAADGWTLVTERGNLSAQFEHTMVITRGRPILLTLTS